MNSFLTLALVGLLATVASAEPWRIYILAGQSNMDGRGQKKELVGDLAPYAAEQADVKIVYSNSTIRGPYSTTQPMPLAPGYSVPPGTREKFGKDYKLPGSTFGPEVSFGRAIADARKGEKILLMKFSEGGTSLDKDWNIDARGKLYDQMLAFLRKNLDALGEEYELCGFIWHQGESDAHLPAGEYQKRSTAFIERLRADLGAPHMPIVIGEVFDNKHRDRVREGERKLAETVYKTYFVSASGLSTSDNGTHFDTASQIEFGKRMAKALP